MQVNSVILMHSCRLFLLYFHLLFFGGRPQATVKSQFLNNTDGIDNENICPRIRIEKLPPENEIFLLSMTYPIRISLLVYCFRSWHKTESDRNVYRILITFYELCSEEMTCDQEHLFILRILHTIY